MTYFEKMPGYIWFEDKFIKWPDATTHLMSHALHYGSAVFEGIRVYDGQIFKLEEHVNRFINSAHHMKMKLEKSHLELCEIIKKVANKQINSHFQNNKFLDSNGYIRPFAFRGAEQMSIGFNNNKCYLAVAAWKISENFVKKQEKRSSGLKLEVAKYRNQTIKEAPVHAKASGLYVNNGLAYYEAMQNGFDDALMLDSQGFVSEATGANIFFLINNELITPTTNSCLIGITRQCVFEIAQKLGINVIEKNIELKDALRASEVFMTGTAVEITPIIQINEHKFALGKITKHIIDQYKKYTKTGTL